jgi:hypothetical protein
VKQQKAAGVVHKVVHDELPADLQRIMDAWPQLSTELRAYLISLVARELS